MYNYQNHRNYVFTEEGSIVFLKIRDRAKHLIDQAGAVTLGKLISMISGNTWDHIACVDRLVELGELRHIGPDDVMTQHQVCIRT